MKRNIIIVFALFILAGIAIYQNLASAGKDVTNTNEAMPKVGFMAPSAVLKGLDGQMYTIGGQRDKPLLINFWASWCGPCEDEAPDLQQIYNKFGGRFDLYAVNFTENDTVQEAQAFVKLHKFTFPALLDSDGTAAKKYGVDSIPTSFLIDRNGVVREVIMGVVNPVDLGKKINKLAQ